MRHSRRCFGQAVPNGYHDDDNYGGDDDDFDERERRDGPAVKTALQYAIDDARRGDIRKRVLTGSRCCAVGAAEGRQCDE